MNTVVSVLLTIGLFIAVGGGIFYLQTNPNAVVARERKQAMADKVAAAAKTPVPEEVKALAVISGKDKYTPVVVVKGERVRGSGVTRSDARSYNLRRIGDTVACFSVYRGQKTWLSGTACWEKDTAPTRIREYVFDAKPVPDGALAAVSTIPLGDEADGIDGSYFPGLGLYCITGWDVLYCKEAGGIIETRSDGFAKKQ